MNNKCSDAPEHDIHSGITIHFISIDIFDDDGAAAGKEYLKTWWNWKGVIPEKNDIVTLHWGDYSEESDTWKVAGRSISGTKEGEITIYLTKIGTRL